ncbi:MAG: hypothetical protein ACK41U_03305 [Paracoccus sp. (in: a-proteobacteria)]|uniref:hypothetical protein n=1 Tax=Paracoccus sp. TaxID=267 RepID=UPI00391942B8
MNEPENRMAVAAARCKAMMSAGNLIPEECGPDIRASLASGSFVLAQNIEPLPVGKDRVGAVHRHYAGRKAIRPADAFDAMMPATGWLAIWNWRRRLTGCGAGPGSAPRSSFPSPANSVTGAGEPRSTLFGWARSSGLRLLVLFRDRFRDNVLGAGGRGIRLRLFLLRFLLVAFPLVHALGHDVAPDVPPMVDGQDIIRQSRRVERNISGIVRSAPKGDVFRP